MRAGRAGFALEDKFLLTIVPALVGSSLRLPYTFAIAKFGGRNWTVVQRAAAARPDASLALVLLEPGVSLSTLLVVTAIAGVGGGNFASSMANINDFYPERLKGRALGLNAGGGNLGVAAVQLVGLLVLATAGHGAPARADRPLHPAVVVRVLAWLDDGQPHVGAHKMIPAIFRAKAARLVVAGADAPVADREARRLSGALIGIAGAVGAFGGVLVNVAFRQSFLETGAGNAAYVAFLASTACASS